MNRRRESRKESRRIAVCGILTALSVLLMLGGGLIPVATYAAPMAAAVLLLPVVFEFGRTTAWTCYAAVSLVSLMLATDKEAALFYFFIGYYPILKWDLDRIHGKLPRVLAKFLVFNLSLGIMYALLCFVLHLDALTKEFAAMGPWLLIIFWLGLIICLFLYDRLLLPLSLLYWNRIRPRLRFLSQ